MNKRTDIDLTSSDYTQERVLGDGRDLKFVSLVEGLLPLDGVVHDSEPRHVVHDLLLAGGVQGVVRDRLVLLQQILVVVAEDPGQDEVELLLGRLPQVEGLRGVEQLLELDAVGDVLVDLAVEVHVEEGVPLVGDQDAVDVLEDETDGGRPNPGALLVLEVDLAEDPVHTRVAAAPDEHSLVLNLVRLALLDLPTIVQLKDQCLVEAWIEDDLLDTITLRDLIHTFFDINERLSKMQWFNFILAHALILKSHSQYPSIING